MIKKIADAIEMSFDIPDSEREHAKIAIRYLNRLNAALGHAKKHLNIIYDPFKDAESISTNVIVKFRSSIRRFKKQVKKNYNRIKLIALNVIIKLSEFSSDTHIRELINTFKDSVEELEKQVNLFFDILDDFRSEKYKENVISGVEGVRKHSSIIERLLKDRVINHLNSNILSNDWVANTSSENNIEMTNKIPYITQLFKERQKALKG